MFHTPLSSPIVTDDDDSSDDEMFFADEGTVKFLEGYILKFFAKVDYQTKPFYSFSRDSVTKMDYAVFNALPQYIDSQKYPFIYFWRHEIEVILKQDPNK